MGKRNIKERPPWAQNIVKRRKELGWTQLKLAEKAELHLNTVVKIELGKDGDGNKETRKKIAKALGCKMSDIYADESEIGSKTMNDLIEIIKRQEAENLELRRALDVANKHRRELQIELLTRETADARSVEKKLDELGQALVAKERERNRK